MTKPPAESEKPAGKGQGTGPWIVALVALVLLVVLLVIATQKTPPPTAPQPANVPLAGGPNGASSDNTPAANAPQANAPQANPPAATNAPAAANAPRSARKPDTAAPAKPQAAPPVNPSDLPPGHPAITTADDDTQVGIQWLGYSCFYIHSPGGIAVVTDPFDPKVTGLKEPDTGAHLVTVSDGTPGHDHTAVVHPFRDEAGHQLGQRVIHGTPAQEGDMQITPVPTGSGNFAYVIQAGALRIAHLGDLRHPLAPEQLKAFGDVDILMVPTGGEGLKPREAAAIAKALKPKIVMPMAYRTPDAEGPLTRLQPLTSFLSATPFAVTAKDTDVTMLSKSQLPASTEVYTFRLQR